MTSTELLIVLSVMFFFAGSVSFLIPSKRMRKIGELRLLASREGFKIGSTAELRKRLKLWTFQDAIYQLKNTSQIHDLHYIRKGEQLTLYSPMALKYDDSFEVIHQKISTLPCSILEIIFYQSNIAFVWNE